MAANLIYKSGSFAFNGNFLPTADKAIDARLVIDNSTSLIEIDHAYQGMVVTVTTAGNGVYFCNGSDPTKYDSWVKLATTTGADVGEIATQVSGLNDRVSTLETRANTHDTSITGLTVAVTALNTSINDVSMDVSIVRAGVNDLTKTVADVSSTVVDVSSRLTTVYRVKGSVNSSMELPTQGTVGDVYNTKDTGMNYVYTGEESKWDALGATVDLSGYYDKTHVDASYNDLNTSIGKVNTTVGNVSTNLSNYKTSNDTSIKTIDTSIADIYTYLNWYEA